MSVLKEMMEERKNWAASQELVETRRRVRKTVGYGILLMTGAFVLFNHQWIINLSGIIP